MDGMLVSVGEWCSNMDGMFLLLLLLLLKYYEQVMVYTIWSGNARIVNMPECTEIYPYVGKHSSINETKNVTL